DFTEAYRLGDRIVVYDAGRVVQAAPRSQLLWQPASEPVARIMGIRNVLRGTVVKATPDRIQIRWRGQLLEAVNSPSRSYLPAADSPIAFFIRPEYVRLIRKDRGAADPSHHMNLMEGAVVGEEDFGTTWSLRIRLDAPGAAAQGDHDLEVEVPHLVYEIPEIDRDRRWQFSIHRGSRTRASPPTPASACASAACPLPRPRHGWRAGSSASAWPRWRGGPRARCRGARRSAWPWPARSCSSPRCCCSTSRSRGSTRRRAPRS